MSFHFLYLTFFTSLLSHVLSVSLYINTTSPFSFSSPILKAQTSKINGAEFLFILFSNGTISKLDTGFNFIDKITTISNKKMVDFTICNSSFYSTNSPSIFAIFDGRTDWVIISIDTPTVQTSFTGYTGLLYVYGQGISFSSGKISNMNVVVYYADQMRHLQITNAGSLTVITQRNFTSSTSSTTTQNVMKVILDNGILYSLVPNHLIALYSLSLNKFIKDNRKKSVEISLDFFVDKNTVTIERRLNYDPNVEEMVQVAFPYITPNSTKTLTPFNLLGIRPPVNTFGKRIWIFDTYSVVINLATNFVYDLNVLAKNYTVQTGLPFTNTSTLGFITFYSNTNNFIYQVNDPRIYGFCESLLDNACTAGAALPTCSMKISYCQTCDSTLTKCTKCTLNYTLLNGQCFQMKTTCAVTNCILCLLNGTCVSCATNYILNTTKNQCISNIKTTCLTLNCISCYLNETCITCATNFTLNKTTNQCLGNKKTSCIDTNCSLCYFNDTCITCLSNFTLNTTSNLCVSIIVVSQNQTQTNCSVSNCNLCYLNDTCISCSANYSLDPSKNMCDLKTIGNQTKSPCLDTNCTLCYLNETCLSCASNYTLDSTSNKCLSSTTQNISNKSPSTDNINLPNISFPIIQPNTTNNSSNNTFVSQDKNYVLPPGNFNEPIFQLPLQPDQNNDTHLSWNLPFEPDLSSLWNFLLKLNQTLFQSNIVQTLNQFPASRIIIKPVFAFFSNFDDLQLYNYLNVSFSSAVRQMFGQIQKLQQQKWRLIHFNEIWYDQFGVDLKPIQTYFSSFHRKFFTSYRFFYLQNQANGYVLNTIQFYFSNFILALGVFLTGFFLFNILKSFKLVAYNWFAKFQFWMAFPIFLYEGNIQYMTYLVGFQLKNLWLLDYFQKIHIFFIIFGFFMFMFGVSTIYFFLKYIHQRSANQIFDVCKSSIKGTFYMNFIFGIKNILLGLMHAIISEEKEFIYSKLVFLIHVEIFCLLWPFFMLREKFFLLKSRQWIFLFASFVRILMIMSFFMDLRIAGDRSCINETLSDFYGTLMTIFIIFWPVLVVMDMGQLIWSEGSRIIALCKIREKVNHLENDLTGAQSKRSKTTILKIQEERPRGTLLSNPGKYVRGLKSKRDYDTCIATKVFVKKGLSKTQLKIPAQNDFNQQSVKRLRIVKNRVDEGDEEDGFEIIRKKEMKFKTNLVILNKNSKNKQPLKSMEATKVPRANTIFSRTRLENCLNIEIL